MKSIRDWLGRERWMLAACALLAAGLGMAMPAKAADYPSRPIRMIVPFPPGGGLDTVARVVAQALSERLGVQVNVDNRGGASGAIGVDVGARAAADGYTILFTSSDTITVLPLISKSFPIDVNKDLTPIAKFADLYMLFAANPSFEAKTLGDLVTAAKQRPGKIRFASPGIGAVGHMTFEAFKLEAGIDMPHIPYNGGGPATQAAVAGQVEVLSSAVNIFNTIRSGQLRGLAVASAKRSPLLPEVPTLVESGYPDFVFSAWNGIFAPAGVPKEVVDKLSREILALAESPEVRRRVESVGAELGIIGPTEFVPFLESETRRFQKIVDATKITIAQ